VLLEKLAEHAPHLARLNPIQQISPGERAVLQLVAEGHTTKKIAQELGENEKMVEKHRASLMKKLGVNDVGGLVVQAIKLGLLRIDG
jgi:DNA-binding CsgD family transcriptional regulator